MTHTTSNHTDDNELYAYMLGNDDHVSEDEAREMLGHNWTHIFKEEEY